MLDTCIIDSPDSCSFLLLISFFLLLVSPNLLLVISLSHLPGIKVTTTHAHTAEANIEVKITMSLRVICLNN